METLPHDCASYIFQLLAFLDITAISATCSKMRSSVAHYLSTLERLGNQYLYPRQSNAIVAILAAFRDNPSQRVHFPAVAGFGKMLVATETAFRYVKNSSSYALIILRKERQVISWANEIVNFYEPTEVIATSRIKEIFGSTTNPKYTNLNGRVLITDLSKFCEIFKHFQLPSIIVLYNGEIENFPKNAHYRCLTINSNFPEQSSDLSVLVPGGDNCPSCLPSANFHISYNPDLTGQDIISLCTGRHNFIIYDRPEADLLNSIPHSTDKKQFEKRGGTFAALQKYNITTNFCDNLIIILSDESLSCIKSIISGFFKQFSVYHSIDVHLVAPTAKSAIQCMLFELDHYDVAAKNYDRLFRHYSFETLLQLQPFEKILLFAKSTTPPTPYSGPYDLTTDKATLAKIHSLC